jgi:hypothetical protein
VREKDTVMEAKIRKNQGEGFGTLKVMFSKSIFGFEIKAKARLTS